MNEAGNASARAAGLELTSGTGRVRRFAFPAHPSRVLGGVGGSMWDFPWHREASPCRAACPSDPLPAHGEGLRAKRGSGQTKLPWGTRPKSVEQTPPVQKEVATPQFYPCSFAPQS